MPIEFEQVEYTYPCTQQPTLRNLTLRIPQCRRCAIIGRNGCGKTTLFRLANGLYRPQKGVIRWQGQPLSYDRASLNRLRQQVGLVFQDPEQQLVATTVEEDLSFGLFNLGLPVAEVADRVQQALPEFELSDLADKPVNYLSLGQKKRVSIADIMVLQPKLLLLDEPTAYLDPHQIRNLLMMLEKIWQAGTTILLATHNLDFVYGWAEWLFVMDRGQIVLEGTPETVFNQSEILQELGIGMPVVVNVLEVVKEMLTGNEAFSDDLQQIQLLKQRIQQRLQDF
jgi:cobalt/nickel transport system ATP-binding protein